MDKLEENKPFKLFSDCISVKGHSRSIIVDLTRSKFFFIPNDLYSILQEYDGKKISEITKDYSDENKTIILEYFYFLLENELLFFTELPLNFPKINVNSWELPSQIYQAILDIDENNDYINKSIFNSLDTFNCKYLQLRFFKEFEIERIIEILEMIKGTSIIGVDVFFDFKFLTESFFIKIRPYLFINNVYLFNAPENRITEKINRTSPINVIHLVEKITDVRNCGVISQSYFSMNLTLFSMSQTNNTCLNRKISIDIEGNIKNCPSLKECFGNIKNTTLEEALNKKDFKKYWTIKKDDIAVCKDCEFRHICTDCRAYIENPDDIYSKPLKCGYNPYTNEWEEWSTNPLKQKAIKYYGMQDLI